MELPSSCSLCPFYQYKDDRENGFVPDVVTPGSKVYILGQNPGYDEVWGQKLLRRYYNNVEYEEVQPQPLIGASGQLFNERFLPLTGLSRKEVSLGNVIRCRPGKALGLAKADELPTLTSTMRLERSKADIVHALRYCRETHFKPPESTKIVVTMGRYAMFALTGILKDENTFGGRALPVLEAWRGYGVDIPDWYSIKTIHTDHYHDLQSQKIVFMTNHIAALFRDKKFYHAVLQDFHKIKLLLNNQWPLPLPPFSTSLPATWPHYAAFDTEYDPNQHNQLERWSLADLKGNVYCIEADHSKQIPIEPDSTVVIQNALADIEHLQNIIDFSNIKVEDMMLAHSVLWSGEPHNLNYINSMYGSLNRYKHLSGDNPQLYAALDAYEPMYMWKKYFIPEFKRDRDSWRVYQKFRLPLIHIINKAQTSGVKVDAERLKNVQSILQERVSHYQERAREISGSPMLNLGGSKELSQLIYK